MQTSDIPSLLPVPFAQDGTRNEIPTGPSSIVGRASLTTGFPPETMIPIVAGGKPPLGNDFNGILYSISDAVRWAQAGAGYSYDAAFAAAIGGYPKGSVLRNTARTGFWLSTTENNTTNPDGPGSANWIPIINNFASTVIAGIIQIATTAQAQAMHVDDRAITPLKLQQAIHATTGMAVYTVPGLYAWAVPEGVTKVYAQVFGAGGGGGRLSVVPGPSGGAQGGYWEGVFDVSGVSAVSVTVGSGGAGATADNSSGAPGAASSFGTYCSAQGGAGGGVTGSASVGGGANGTTGTGREGGRGSVAIRDAANSGVLGGAGGGFWSPYGSIDDGRPLSPGMGGAGRTASNAASGGHGAVILRW